MDEYGFSLDPNASYAPGIADTVSGWGTGSTTPDYGSTGGSSWWQDTLGFVIKAAAVDRYSPKQIQSTGQYQVDQYGNLVPMGSGVQITGQTSINNNLMMYAVLALGAVLLYSMVKD